MRDDLRAEARLTRTGTYARPVAGIVDGRQWLEERLKHLEAELEADPPAEKRELIETEIERLRAEVRSSRRRFRWWLMWGSRPQP